MQRFFITTLGCKVNQYESRAIAEAWESLGAERVERPEDADYCLLNSCAVTSKAMADVRATLRRLRRSAPLATIFVSGCGAALLTKELTDLPQVRSIPQRHKDLLSRELPWKTPSLADIPRPSQAADYPSLSVSGYDRSRAVLKIQDGCSHACAYCIVPLTRGRARSRLFDEALAEARRLLRSGFREIVISGVNLRQFRMNETGDFWDFLKVLDASLTPEWAGRARFRISSLEPGQLNPRALEILSRCSLVAPHLHLSLQSGSGSVLRRMGRGHYEPEDIASFLTQLRVLWPVFGLGADILTAFPGESEDEFEQGRTLIQALPLTCAHVFPYSKRPGTRAASMPGHLSPQVKKERAATLRNIVNEKKKAFVRSLLTLPSQHVVFEARSGRESSSDQHWRGVNEFYVDCRWQPRGETMSYQAEMSSNVPGALWSVRPVAVKNDVLLVVPEGSEHR